MASGFSTPTASSSALVSLGTGLARALPSDLKRFIHRQKWLDRFTLRVYGRMMNGRVCTVREGPMAGIRLKASKDISHAHIGGTYERDVQDAISSVIRPGMLCYDLGASVGYMSLLMAHRGARKVYALEPAPHAAGVLGEQVAANGLQGIIEHVPLAVSDHMNPITFSLTDNAYGSRIGGSSTRTTTVQCTTLDSFAVANGYPDFIKMDVEAEEVRVLLGADAVLRKKPTLCIEIHGPREAEGVARILTAHGYRIRQITPEGLAEYHPGEARPGDVQVLATAS